MLRPTQKVLCSTVTDGLVEGGIYTINSLRGSMITLQEFGDTEFNVGNFRPIGDGRDIHGDNSMQDPVNDTEVQVLKPVEPPKPTGVIKIAGLGNLVQGVRDQISGLRSELPALGESITALRSSVADVKAQVDAVHDDLKFEAQTLGNGSEN
jgi:hypothetical protein